MTHQNETVFTTFSIENPDPELELIKRGEGCLRCGADLSKSEREEGRKFCVYCVE